MAPAKNYADNFSFEWNDIGAKTQVDSFGKVGQSVNRVEGSMGWKESDVRGKLVLDVGCGSGRYSDVMCRWGADVVGLDYSKSVDAAKKNTDELGYAAEYVQADALKLPFADGTFDAVFSIGVLQFTPDPLQGIRELCRVLKPGGLLGVAGIDVRTFRRMSHPRFIFRPLTSKIPAPILFKLVKAWVKFALPISRFMRTKLKLRYGFVERIMVVANYEGAVPGIDGSNVFDWALLDTFDWLSPAHNNPQKQKDVENTIKSCGMANIINLGTGTNDYRAIKMK